MVRSWILTTKNWEIAWILTDPLDILKVGDWAKIDWGENLASNLGFSMEIAVTIEIINLYTPNSSKFKIPFVL